MADLSVQVVALTGLKETQAAAAAGGDAFLNSGHEFLHVKNGGGGEVTITVDSQTACNQGGTHDVAVAVPAGEERLIGPLPKARFNDENEKAQVTYSGVASVTVSVVRLP